MRCKRSTLLCFKFRGRNSFKGVGVVKDKLLNLAVCNLRLINELSCVTSKFLNKLWTLKFSELI